MICMMMIKIKNCPLSTIRTKTTQVKYCQLSTIYNCYLQFGKNLNKELSSKSVPAKAMEVSFQDKVVQAKILYINLTDLLETIIEIVGKLNLTKYSWIKSFKCNLVYFFAIKIPKKAIQLCFFYVTG